MAYAAGASPAEDSAINDFEARNLQWELVAQGPDNSTRFLPLEQMSDTSLGGRQAGVVRLRLGVCVKDFDKYNVRH